MRPAVVVKMRSFADTWTKARRRMVITLSAVPAAFVLGCGGGEGSGTSPQSTSCNMESELASAPRTASFTGYLGLNRDTNETTVRTERWPLLIEGQPHQLNVVIAIPKVRPLNGIVFFNHGNAGTSLAQLPPERMRSEAELRFATRGYASVYIARRGNYGSSGSFDDPTLRAFCDKASAKDCTRAALKSQAVDVEAAMEYAVRTPQLGPLMQRTILLGASGGAFTVTWASSSNIFKMLPTKAVIRLHGVNSRSFDTPEYFRTHQEFWDLNAEQGPKSTSSLWLVGDRDAITSPKFLACEFRSFSVASGFPNSFAIVPGWDHGSEDVLFSSSVYPVVSRYLRDQGFPGFN